MYWLKSYARGRWHLRYTGKDRDREQFFAMAHYLMGHEPEKIWMVFRWLDAEERKVAIRGTPAVSRAAAPLPFQRLWDCDQSEAGREKH